MLAEIFQRSAAGVLQSLPAPVLRLLSGHPAPIERDGLTLEPDMQLTLSILRLMGHRGLDTMTPAEGREDIRRSTAMVSAIVEPVERVDALEVPGPAGSMPARLYVPRGDGRPGPLVVYYHGGGWVLGDLDTHDALCRFLASQTGARVLAIDYRLAPEHKFPAAVEDAVEAFRWAVGAAALLGIDAERVAVAGDSAGGNLSAVVSQVTTREGGPRPVAQLLVYPATDLANRHTSYRTFAEGFFLTAAEMDWYIGHYLPSPEAAHDPRASPLLAPDLGGLPPAIVLTAGFDPLRDEGEAYAKRMKDAGVRVVLHRHDGLIHGFANMTATSRPSRAAMAEATRLLAAELAERH